MSKGKLVGVIVVCTVAIVVTMLLVAGSSRPQTYSGSGIPRTPASFSVSGLRIHPIEIGTGEQLTISVLVKNEGGVTGDYQVVFQMDNRTVRTEDVRLHGGGTRTVEITVTVNQGPGAYSVDVNGLSGTFSVRRDPEPIPIRVSLQHFGVKCAHGGNVQLVVLVGDEENTERYLFPPVQEGYSMGDYETKRIGEKIFHTASVRGNLKMTVLAYHRDQSKTDYLALIDMMAWYYGDSINMLRQLVLNMPTNDVLIGHYERVWSQDELRSITRHEQYNEVGIDDLRLWFSIWPEEEPPSPPQPSLFPEKSRVYLDGYPLFYTGALYFERELRSGDTVNITVRQTPPYASSAWRNWGFSLRDPKGQRVGGISEREAISGSFSYTAVSDGIYTIRLWNSGYPFTAEVQFEPIEWVYVSRTYKSRVIYCG